ncbi:MAG: Rieske 2Fe-2S domain-containing protein [Alkalinema sp. RU_4_3]|nr:Rieske 2Fe-2S domain-containing protein [Alkalinema sp. RU_4_3]
MVTAAAESMLGLSNLLGGPEDDRFDAMEAWYPVFYLRDLDKTKPAAFTLLDIDLVLWWDKDSNSWRAMEDQCPHRLAQLSEGRIAEDGKLECPYHGWAFNGQGGCDRIPQQSTDQQAETSSRACVKTFKTTMAQGMLFVYLGVHGDRVPVPEIGPWVPDSDGWICFDTFRDLPYDAFTLLENVLDASHLPFTHHKSVGNRVNAAPMDLEITESDRHGFKGIWPEGPRKGKLGTQTTTFIAPNLMWHDLTSKQFGRTITAVYATPIRKGECRLFARFPFQFSSKIPEFFIKITPRWYSHMGQNAILEDDQVFLHLQERYLAQKGGADQFSKAFYLPTKADLFVFEFRQWINQYQAEPFPGQALPPRQTRSQLLDRHSSHTQNCVSCQGALKRIRRIRLGIVGAIVLLLAAAQIVVAPVMTVGGAIALLGLWWGLGKWERKLLMGDPIPARNRS